MRIPFLFLFLIGILCGKAWAQPKIHPLIWSTNELSNARTQATTPYTTTLKLPFFYDFSSRYIHIDSIQKGTTASIFSLRPHGLVSNDSVEVSGALGSATIATFNGKKVVKRISDYEFQLYNDAAFASPLGTSITVDYLRISKLGARETSKPDTLAFYDNHSGVQINGGSGKNQPSYYIARFDGLNENGTPYVPSTSSQIGSDPIGYTDSLRSQPFNLSSYVASDSLYMSFYYQYGGYGEQPDAVDHLYLEFLDATSNWVQVKDMPGAVGSADAFYVAMVPIKDPNYFHNAFQYRFRSFGRQSGAYDVWNVDYIYINKNRNAADSTIGDVAFRSADYSFLENYTAMPFNHFFTSSSYNTNYFKNKKSVSAVSTIQGPSFSLTKTFELNLKDQFDNTLAYSDVASTESYIYRTKTFNDTLRHVTFPVIDQPIYADLTYSFADGQRSDVGTAPFELMFNNTLTKRTYLYDYYAYDDGEAEVGFGSSQPGSQIAYQFVAAQQDLLTHVDICFTRTTGPSLENSQIYLMVWKNSLTDPSPQSTVISIHYQNYVNGFSRYKLSSPIQIDSAAKFYIGYKQNIAQLIAVGYDRNRDSRSNSYYKESTQWQRMDSSGVATSGTMMMRPVFFKASNNVPTGIKYSEVNKNGLLLYPNPASSTIDIVATETVTDLQYTMYSLYGQVVSSGLVTSTNHTLDVSQLSTGMYIVICTDIQGKIYSTRFFKE